VATAKRCITQLYVVFPKSARVGKLDGMRMEAEGQWEAALQKYNALLEKSPAEQRVMKRKAAVYKAQGKLPEARPARCCPPRHPHAF